MGSPPGREERLYRILEGASSTSSPIIDRSALGVLTSQSVPALPKKSSLFRILVPTFLCSVVADVLLYDRLTSLFLKSAAVSIPLTIMFLLWYVSHLRHEKVRNFIELLENPLRELINIQAYINNWLADLDTRTSRYFHCVTNTKVTDYFVLTQIQNALKTRIEEVEILLSNPSAHNLLAAFHSLKGTLVFHDGVVKGMGNMYTVPLARVNIAITKLMENLEIGLRELEEEIVFARTQIESDKPNHS